MINKFTPRYMPRDSWRRFWQAARKNGFAYEMRSNDPLAAKLPVKEQIEAAAQDGKVQIVVDQMDCDCVRWTSSSEVDANLMAVMRHYDRIFNDAEGPVYGVSIVKPEVKVEYRSRDLALEAFEEGHPHVVYP